MSSNSEKDKNPIKPTPKSITHEKKIKRIPTRAFLKPHLLRSRQTLCSGIHRPIEVTTEANNSQPVQRKFIERIQSTTAPKSKTITCLTVNTQRNILFVGYQKGYFQAIDCRSFERLPDYEPTAEPKTANPIVKIRESDNNGFFVICRNSIVEYLYDQYKYEFKYQFDCHVKEIFTHQQKNFTITSKGEIFEFTQNTATVSGIRRSGGLNRDIKPEVLYEIGGINQLIQLSTPKADVSLVLVRHNHNIALLNIFNFPVESMIITTQRLGLSVKAKTKIQFKCNNYNYYYATSNKTRKTENRIYYNKIDLIGQDLKDLVLETRSGSIIRMDASNNFLIVFTQKRQLEVFNLISHTISFDIAVGYDIRRCISYNNSMVIITKEGYLIAREIPFDNSCCLHCEVLFSQGIGFKVCAHFLPRRPYTENELTLMKYGIKFDY